MLILCIWFAFSIRSFVNLSENLRHKKKNFMFGKFKPYSVLFVVQIFIVMCHKTIMWVIIPYYVGNNLSNPGAFSTTLVNKIIIANTRLYIPKRTFAGVNVIIHYCVWLPYIVWFYLFFGRGLDKLFDRTS